MPRKRSSADACVDLIYIDPPFNGNGYYEVFWGESKENRALEDGHASKEPAWATRTSDRQWGVSKRIWLATISQMAISCECLAGGQWF